MKIKEDKVKANGIVRICSEGGCKSDDEANEYIASVDPEQYMAWELTATAPNTCFQFSLESLQPRAEDRKKGEKNIKRKNQRNRNRNQRNGNRKQKNGNRNQRNRNRRPQNKGNNKQNRNAEDEDDQCETGWVMIVKGEVKTIDPEVILPKTCITRDMQDLNITGLSNEIKTTVYYFRNKSEHAFELTAEPRACPNPDLCLWDCEWQPNPFYRETTFWRLGGWDISNPCGQRQENNEQENDKDSCVEIYLTMPKIPTSLECLDDCFFNSSSNYQDKCKRELGKSATGSSDDPAIDCILVNRRSDIFPSSLQSEGNRNFVGGTFPLKDQNLIPEIGYRKRKSLLQRQTATIPPSEIESESVSSNNNVRPVFSYLPTREPLDAALTFCIMANLDARKKLPSPNKTGGFYTEKEIWGREESCVKFLPNFFSKSSSSAANSDPSAGRTSYKSITRVSGQTSAKNER